MYFRLCYQKITIFYNWGEMSRGETSLGEKRRGEKCRGEKRLLGRTSHSQWASFGVARPLTVRCTMSTYIFYCNQI